MHRLDLRNLALSPCGRKESVSSGRWSYGMAQELRRQQLRQQWLCRSLCDRAGMCVTGHSFHCRNMWVAPTVRRPPAYVRRSENAVGDRSAPRTCLCSVEDALSPPSALPAADASDRHPPKEGGTEPQGTGPSGLSSPPPPAVEIRSGRARARAGRRPWICGAGDSADQKKAWVWQPAFIVSCARTQLSDVPGWAGSGGSGGVGSGGSDG